MKQLNMIKTAVKLTLVFLLFLLFTSSTYAARTISLADMEFSLSEIDCDNLGVIVWDQREQIINKSQPETFLGYLRSLVGIAWPYFVKEEQNLNTLLLDKIQKAYAENGININPISSAGSETNEQILEKVKSYDYEKVLVIKLDTLQFDGVQRMEYVVDIEIQLFNTSGDMLYSNIIKEKIPMGSVSKRKETVPATLKAIIEGALNEPETVDAINNI